MTMENTLSKTQQLIVLAYNKGYRIIDGRCHTPKGKILKGSIKQHPIPYYQLSLNSKEVTKITGSTNTFGITYHALLAYQLYKEDYFKDGMVARHKNGNSLDNSDENIILGTQKDNKLDTPQLIRSDATRKGYANKIRVKLQLQNIKQDYLNGIGAKQLYIKYDISLAYAYKLIQQFKKLH